MSLTSGKSGLTPGQNEPNFKNRQFVASNCHQNVEKIRLHVYDYRNSTLFSKSKPATRPWSKQIALKGKLNLLIQYPPHQFLKLATSLFY